MNEINEDELVGYILRRAYEVYGDRLDYEEVSRVLEFESEFLREKGFADTAER